MYDCEIKKITEMKVKEILTIDLTEDIKNVIDLEDISEKEIQAEIESYIVTDGLARSMSDLLIPSHPIY